jgi:hypothetical protein
MTAPHPHALLLPDILHEIFPRLPCATLLRCERVCRTWQQVISRSSLAQQRLFRVADPTALDPLLAIEAHDVAEQNAAAYVHPQRRLNARPEFRALFNPWVLRGMPFAAEWGAWGRPVAWRIAAWRITDRVSCGAVGFVMARREFLGVLDEQVECWRGMFVVQPPVKRVLGWVGLKDGNEEAFEVEVEEGVRVGDVLRKAGQTGVAKGLRGRRTRTRARKEDEAVRMRWQFDEHFTGVKFFKLERLERDAEGVVRRR